MDREQSYRRLEVAGVGPVGSAVNVLAFDTSGNAKLFYDGADGGVIEAPAVWGSTLYAVTKDTLYAYDALGHKGSVCVEVAAPR